LNGTVYLRSNLLQRAVSETEAVYLSGYMSESKREGLMKATGCVRLIELDEDAARSFAAGVFISLDEGRIRIDGTDGLSLIFETPENESASGFIITAFGNDGAELISRGGEDYHGGDLTIYLKGGGEYRTVKE
ncbi:MAG: hypothetical protein Q4B42_03785, partial [Oscillospiraceae bacterium]|nr:hypothetical protein [Oscillospiraceae bacterium]